jgi:hypothetical protein
MPVARTCRGWSSSFDALTTEALEFIDVGNDRVVVWVRISGRAKGSGIEPPPAYFATVVELRNSKIARAVEYPTLAEAVEAASASRKPCAEPRAADSCRPGSPGPPHFPRISAGE